MIQHTQNLHLLEIDILNIKKIIFYKFMQTLLSNKNSIFEIIKKVENLDNSLFIHYNYPNISIYDDTISIVMTSSNRSKQVYYTLKTIEKCSFKHVHLIIVDDSNIDQINKDILCRYPFNIDFICIKDENKKWNNPVVNYNIGFQFIKGCKVVIQNAEVCYVGDILGFVSSNIIDNNYYIFDVNAVSSFENNEIIYNTDNLTTKIYNENIYLHWYQHRKRCVNYHFLTALTRKTFELVKNFSYDYTFGFAYDDDDFLLKIKSKNINLVNLFNDIYNFGGIHLWHNFSYKSGNIESNLEIFEKKKNYYSKIGEYIDIITSEPEIIKIDIIPDTNLLKLQDLFIQFNSERIIYFYINKKKITPAINTFRKCILKGYLYKNSGIKIPKNLKIKFYYV
jgi:hypothetical protein